MELNPAQREAVHTIQGPVLILAGAGTGKTRVITARIAHLVRSGVPPTAILAVTFTNKAANEMRARAAKVVGSEKVKDVTISTFHALCVRMLRGGIERLGYKRNFTIYDEADQFGLIKKIITRTASRDEKLDPGLARSMISKAKNGGWPEAEGEESLLGAVYRRYVHELKLLNAVDFDDLLLLTVRLLREHDDVRERWQQRYTHIMVDEFQDTNSVQLDLLRLLTSDPPNVCVVGDDDQSIYGWRGAEVSNILEFERHFPKPKIVKLEQNYRSTTTILQAANSVIRNNPRRRAKSLWSSHGAGEPIRLICMPGERDEARFVAEDIQKRRVEENLPWEDFAVLFRMNTQAQPFEEQFRQLKLPYHLIGARSFFDRREVKDLVAWLTVLIHPEDDISLLRIINAPPRGIGETTIGRALDASVQNNCSVFATLRSSEFQAALAKKTVESIRHFIGMIEEFGVQITAPLADYPTVAKRLIEETGYLEYIKRSCQTAEEAAGREQSLNRVLDWMQDRKSPGSGVREFLDELVLDRDRQENNDNKPGITLITMHAAKGLEFKYVYIVGIEEGVLPHSRSKEENRIDEERRLFYVAITRAKRTLCLSWCDHRMRYGQIMPCTRSSFLREIDPALIVEESYHELQNRPATEATAKLHFAAIREMLGAARRVE